MTGGWDGGQAEYVRVPFGASGGGVCVVGSSGAAGCVVRRQAGRPGFPRVGPSPYTSLISTGAPLHACCSRPERPQRCCPPLPCPHHLLTFRG